ncbi:MAG: aldehyde dehydrogenase family protein [Candidatus Acidiferrales bacterium]
MLHIPILRKGRPYKSLDVARTPHHRTKEPFVEVSQANAGVIRRDLLDAAETRELLSRFTIEELLAVCERAAPHFANDTLPLGDAQQSPQDYIEQVSATTGLPFVMARRNMEKIRTMLASMREVIAGLTRGLDLRVLDEGFGEINGSAVSFFPRANNLGVVLPSNSPGVHSLWIPAIAMKIPLVLKPGSGEPWTPYRIIQALIRAGCPAEVFGYYPTDHAGAGEILRQCGRGMFFGDAGSLRAWEGDSRIELHGPGYSKVVLADDAVGEWEKYLDVMVASILSNSGRSCVNASGVWVTGKADEIAEALAERLAKIKPFPADDERAEIAPFASPDVAQRISAMIDDDLREPGARDVTAAQRKAGRVAEFQGCTYLLPTIVRCDSREHPLANREFLFPFASVVQIEQEQLPAILGPSLVVSAITSDAKLIRRLTSSNLIGRLNLGPIPTPQIRWDQPHEGNLFDHLYARRAFQSALATAR